MYAEFIGQLGNNEHAETGMYGHIILPYEKDSWQKERKEGKEAKGCC